MSVQVELTVTSGRTHLPVVKTSRYTGVVMAVTATIDGALLTETGGYLLLESGDILLLDVPGVPTPTIGHVGTAVVGSSTVTA